MLDQVGAFDFAFVDSGPGEGPKKPDIKETRVRLRHWKAAQERIDVGGIVVCHDMNAHGWDGGDEIMAESLVLSGGRGIAIWRKR